jgi:cbb3-type cytochrome oxidase subunit 3
MKSAVLSQFTLTYLPVIACLLFVAIFIGVIFWVLRPGSKSFYEQAGQIPLLDEKRIGEKI